MKVFVLEKGQWDKEIVGVYASAEAAIAANPVPDDALPYMDDLEVGWIFEEKYGYWHNGALGLDHRVLTEYEVQDAVPTRPTTR